MQSFAGEDDGYISYALLLSDRQYFGTTPLTVRLPPGEYVLAIRATARQDGFDGNCKRKWERDPITGGKRFGYHLYALRKHRGEYICFVANFTDPDTKPSAIGTELQERGTYNIPLDELVNELATTTGVPDRDLVDVAETLNLLGIAYYEVNQQYNLLKLTINGNTYRIDEWSVQ